MAPLFLGLTTVLLAARALGALARRLGQPAVIGEILAGVVLGPTVLPQSVSGVLVPSGARPLLGGLAAVGLATFVFVVGHELAASFGLHAGRIAAGIATGSVLLPLAGGCLVALAFAEAYAPAGRLRFVAFVGVAMAATAFPVLARILTELRLREEPVGRLAMAAAAANDAVTWILLAAVVASAGAGGPWRVALVPAFLAVLAYGVRPTLARTQRGRGGTAEPGALVVGLMLCCAATDWMGVHYVLGAFAFGVVVARSTPSSLRHRLVGRVESIGAEVLLPVYFVMAGMQVDLSDLGGGTLGVLAAVVAVGIVTKTGGAYLGGRLGGLPKDGALTLAVLMNTRGLTEIVVLTVGLKLRLIDGRFYSAMVMMALITTMMTGPLLNLLMERRQRPALRSGSDDAPGRVPLPARGPAGEGPTVPQR